MLQSNSEMPRWRATKEFLTKVQTELARRDLKDVPTADLIDLFVKLGKAVKADDRDYRKGRKL